MPGSFERLPGILICMRPGVEEMLAHACDRFEVHIFTMGERRYADAVAHILEARIGAARAQLALRPLARHVNRIVSRNELGDESRKDLREMFPSHDSMVSCPRVPGEVRS